jgi:DNA-binding MarR family transcriptional regulator
MKPNTQPQDAIDAVLRTADALRRRAADVLSPSGLTPQQFNVLRILKGARGQPLPTLDIADSLIEPVPGITRLLDRLELKGLIRRERAAGDRRVVHCVITALGLEVVSTLEPMADAASAQVFEDFDADDVETLLELLESVQVTISPDNS